MLCLLDSRLNTLDPEESASERIIQHQLTILASAFYIVEQFSNDSSPVGRATSLLLAELTRLAGFMLRDTQRRYLPPVRLTEVFMTRFSGNTMSVGFAQPVLLAWTRGMQRLLLGGRITRENCEVRRK